MGRLTMRKHLPTIVSLVALSFVDTALAACTTTTGNCAPVACTTAGQKCCRPDDNNEKYCVQVKPSDINVTDGVCLYANTYGQTPDANAVFNAPWVNNFLCGTNDGACNFNSEAAINDVSYTQQPSDTSGEKDYSVSGAAIYYAALPNISQTDKTFPANQSRTYWEAFNRALSRYNCEEQYSHWNCDDCRKAYARWACAMTYPACEASPCEAKKPCVRVCNEVVQKCPVTLGFTCPDDNRDYAESGCNFMGLKSGASNVPVSLLSATAMAGIALALA